MSDSFYLDGAFVPAGEREALLVTEKATGAVLAQVPAATKTDVDAAVAGSLAAQAEWARRPVGERVSVLRRAAVLLAERRQTVEALLIREAGSARSKAQGEVSLSIDELEHAAFLALSVTDEILPSTVGGRINIIERRPVGCVGLITAFNFPLQIAIRIMAPALALGNSVVLKPAPLTSFSGGALVASLMHDAGLPPGLLQVVYGDAAGPAMVAHPDVNMIHFTGSAAVGGVIAVEAARTLKKVALELGGNSASVVFPDADLDLAASAGAEAGFTHQGQVCIATSRHLVFRSIAEEYLGRLTAHAAALRVGDPAAEEVDLGPLISERQLSHVDRLVQDAVRRGAQLSTGGTYNGLFYRPTVLSEVTPQMAVFQEEIFGPVAPITIVESAEEALQLVNGVSHALSSAVFTADAGRGWAFARRVHAGMVHVNEPTALHEVHIPFGGIGGSGMGERLGGRANIDLLTERRWTSIQGFPS